jgi:DNA-binding transcriptional MerR regulator
MTANVNENELDKEWFDLIMEARKLGISFDEIKEFLNKNRGKA